MTTTLTVDDLQFEVRRSERRVTLEIIVDRGGELVVHAPPDCAPQLIEEFVREKRFWIYTKLALKKSLLQPAAAREFVTGEGFPYLGRSYRLLIVDEQDRTLKLEHGRFKIRRSGVQDGRGSFIQWYSDHARLWISQRIKRFTRSVGDGTKGIEIRDLGFRWGSCGKGGALYFHWAVILMPPSIIDYVLTHELAHLHEKNHTPEFWRRIERAMPDYESRKKWLAENGGGLVSL